MSAPPDPRPRAGSPARRRAISRPRDAISGVVGYDMPMARSIWSGAISFGLVNVPVKLYSAVSKKTVRFNQLHAADGARINQKRVCSVDGAEVPYEDIVKGYEVAPDRYVVVTPQELDALDPIKTKTIDIEDFVDLDQIDPIYFDQPYYLAPATGAAKAYGLLVNAMRDAGKVAIAKVVIRQKEQLTAIRASGDVLVMATMNFADEVIPAETIDELKTPAGAAEASERELQMARQLIDSLAGDFDPGKYRDEYRERVLELIERKAEGQEIAVQPVPEAPKAVPDLMAALEASLAAVAERPAVSAPAAKPRNGRPAKRASAAKPASGAKPARKRAGAAKQR